MSMRIRFVVRAAVIVLAMVAASKAAFGATVIYTGDGGNENWSNPGNWDGGVPIADADRYEDRRPNVCARAVRVVFKERTTAPHVYPGDEVGP